MYSRLEQQLVNDDLAKLDCSTCLTEKKIILRDHLAKTNHYARIYAGYIIRRIFPAQNIKNPEIRRDINLFRPRESRSKVLARFIEASARPLPPEYYKPCVHGENEHVKFTQYL